jgi:membrane protein implicated in regulation of membrane protease activity
MPLLILLFVLVALAALGVLGFIIKVAFAVALGVFLAVVGVAAYAMWRFRRAWRRAIDPGRRPAKGLPRRDRAPSRVEGRSEVTVLRPDEPGSGQAR